MNREFIVWLTGLSGAGKSTLAHALKRDFGIHDIPVVLLDGDVIRKGLNTDLGFTRNDRRESIRRITEVAHLFLKSGIIPVVAVISPYEEDRNNARSCLKDYSFIEVFVRCPIEVCEKRDVKGLYKAARNGSISCFTGISDVFEEPVNPEIIIDTAEESEEESLARLKELLNKYMHISRPHAAMIRL